jgi:hypothetical protein
MFWKRLPSNGDPTLNKRADARRACAPIQAPRQPVLLLNYCSMARVPDSAEYKHLVAQGVPGDTAWCAAWVDLAYKYLVTNGMDGAAAYAQALSLFFANGVKLESVTPEQFTREVMRVAYEAQETYPQLDPMNPESSKVVQQKPAGLGKPS